MLTIAKLKAERNWTETDINKNDSAKSKLLKNCVDQAQELSLFTHTYFTQKLHIDIPEKCNAIQDNSLFIYLVIKITVWTWGEFDFFGMINNS